jgi:hypothetical protein
MKGQSIIRILCVFVALASFLFLMPTQTVDAAKAAQWTVAFYMGSDNGLDSWAEKDVLELRAVGSTNNVNIILFWDTDIGPGYMYKVYKNNLVELTDFEYDGIEPNMGDPTVLRSFVSYTFKKFPARNSALVLWDHGDDFRGLMYDEHIPNQGFDLLSNQEVISALSGFKINTMIYAACVMSQIDVTYEYAIEGLNVDYLVATEGYDTMDSFPFDWVLSSLASRPNMTPLEFSVMAVDQYVDFYTSVGKAYSQAATMSVIKVDAADELGDAVIQLSTHLGKDMPGYAPIISSARGQANLPWSQNGWDRLVDLKIFLQSIHDQSLDPSAVTEIDPAVVSSVVTAADTALAKVPQTVLYVRSLKTMDKHGTCGIGVFFPTSRNSFDNNKNLYGASYDATAFATAGWLDFLYAYWDARAQ